MAAIPHTDLPNGDEAGTERTWTLATREGDLTIDARFIGIGTSRGSAQHTHDAAHAARGEKCGACRWFETRVFRVLTSDMRARYVIHSVGRSLVPGEVDLYRHETVFSPHEVIEAFTVRRRAEPGRTQDAFLTRPAARALAQAAYHDRELRDAYVDRAVS